MAENTNCGYFIPFPSSPKIRSPCASSPKESFLSTVHHFSHPTFLSVYVLSNWPLQGVGSAAGMCPCSLWITCIISFHLTNHKSCTLMTVNCGSAPVQEEVLQWFCWGDTFVLVSWYFMLEPSIPCNDASHIHACYMTQFLLSMTLADLVVLLSCSNEFWEEPSPIYYCSFLTPLASFEQLKECVL